MDATARTTDRIAFALPALIAFAFAALAPQVLGDGDSWWHVRAGEWILDHRAVPLTDPFSYTFAGKDWHAHEWLAEVLYALAYRAAGWSGVSLLAGAAVGLTTGLLFQWLARRVSMIAALLAVMLAFTCIAPGMLARPHLLSLPLIVLWLRLLIDARTADRAPHLGWLPLIVVWAYLHGSVLFAVGLIGFFALEALVEEGADRARVIRQWGLFGIGAGLATLLTPRGVEGVVFLVQLTQMQGLAEITEWRPADFTKPGGLELLLLAGLFILLLRGVKIAPLRLLLLLVLLHMTLQHQRHQMLLALAGVMIACDAIGQMTPLSPPARKVPSWALPAIGIVFALVVVVRLALPASVRETATAPASAFAHVPADLLAQPVLNGYDSGGFLIGQGVKPFIDGRTDLYGDAFVARYRGIIDARPGELEKVLAEYSVAWTFLPSDSAAAARLDTLPGWRRVYRDKLVTVHVRQ